MPRLRVAPGALQHLSRLARFIAIHDNRAALSIRGTHQLLSLFGPYVEADDNILTLTTT